MKHNEILILFASKPEFIVYIESFKSQIKELTERLLLYWSCSNQNSRNSNKPLSTNFVIKEKSNHKNCCKKKRKRHLFQKDHLGTTREMVNYFCWLGLIVTLCELLWKILLLFWKFWSWILWEKTMFWHVTYKYYCYMKSKSMKAFLHNRISTKAIYPESVRSPDGPNYSGFSNLLSKLLVYPLWENFWVS